jgi:RNA polymerase sigma-70 factor, ECF subfamily
MNPIDGLAPPERQESECIDAARRGDVEAFTELVRLHQSPIRAFLGRVLQVRATVDDVAQDTFLSAFRNLKSYDERWSFRTWLFGIAKNQACNHLRRESRRSTRESDRFEAHIAGWAAEIADNEQLEDSVKRLSHLRLCIEALPGVSARVIRQHYFEQRSAADIAKRIGRSENAVRILLFRIRQGLRDCILSRGAGGA